MEVTETGLVDPTQFDPAAKYYDASPVLRLPAGIAPDCAFWAPSRPCSASIS